LLHRPPAPAGRPEDRRRRLVDAQAAVDQCAGESAFVQYQLLMHRPSGPPLGAPRVLVLAAPDDRLVPILGVRATTRRYEAEIVQFPRMGHDLMLDACWRESLDTKLSWLGKNVADR
jgi:pimeloyl-ACP methyl ester carboxylesterase